MLKLLLVLGNKEGTKPLVIWANVVRSAYLISSASVLSSIRMCLVIDQTAVQHITWAELKVWSNHWSKDSREKGRFHHACIRSVQCRYWHLSLCSAPVKVSGGQSDQNESPLELAKMGHKIQEEVTECLMLKLSWLVWWDLTIWALSNYIILYALVPPHINYL